MLFPKNDYIPEEPLKKLNKDSVIEIAMNLQLKMESCKKDIIEQLRALIEKLMRLESDLAITKNIKNVLSLRLAEMEKRCWTNS